jgi:CheY-like chemotaxis protein
MSKVLIIEDSPTTRSVIKVYLTGHNLEFLEATDGIDGLALARQHRPGVIVLDLKMPRMDGFTFCRTIRGDARLKATPIILLTSSKGEAVRLEARQAGATHFLNKPIDEQLLASVIIRSLEKDHAGGPSK